MVRSPGMKGLDLVWVAARGSHMQPGLVQGLNGAHVIGLDQGLFNETSLKTRQTKKKKKERNETLDLSVKFDEVEFLKNFTEILRINGSGKGHISRYCELEKSAGMLSEYEIQFEMHGVNEGE